MTAAVAERHIYSPQSCIIDAINSRFLGLYDLSVLPSYYQPTQQSLDFVDRLIAKIVSGDGEVELVVTDEVPDPRHVSLVGEQRVSGGLTMIIGPVGLEESLGGFDSAHPRSWLWDKGELNAELNRLWIQVEGE